MNFINIEGELDDKVMFDVGAERPDVDNKKWRILAAHTCIQCLEIGFWKSLCSFNYVIMSRN